MISFRTFHAQYSYNLFSTSYGARSDWSRFPKARSYAKEFDSRAGAVDRIEAPAKELARQINRDTRTSPESARSINKREFRP
jgi:hypothetical protein